MDLGSVACSLEGEGGSAPGMAADVSDMTVEELSRGCVLACCALCMSVTLRLPVLGSMSPVVLSVWRYCRSSDESSAKVGVEVSDMEESSGRYCWFGGGSCWWGGDMAGRWVGLEGWRAVARMLLFLSVCHTYQRVSDRIEDSAEGSGRRECLQGSRGCACCGVGRRIPSIILSAALLLCLIMLLPNL